MVIRLSGGLTSSVDIPGRGTILGDYRDLRRAGVNRHLARGVIIRTAIICGVPLVHR